ncbi:hypothetical protein [Nitrosococcus watsonii]|uniref:hypothetical protein n=1 Tax=Nitrosococcus watsonii TaxID=473531 RepID=UPI0018E02839|nr:hypothetical protein [Nitrosococcus watsonii]
MKYNLISEELSILRSAIKRFFSVDVEIWPGGDRLDERFPGAFRQYIYGPTGRSDYDLPMTL